MLWLLAAGCEEEQDIVLLIFKKYKSNMYRMAFGILKNHSDAEDTVSETMLKIARHASKFRGKTDDETAALVSTYTKNTAKSLYKKRRREKEHVVSDGDIDPERTADESADIEMKIIRGECEAHLFAAFMRLPEHYRHLLELREMHKLSYKEIAEVLNISVDAVDARLRRARERFAEEIKKEGVTPE